MTLSEQGKVAEAEDRFRQTRNGWHGELPHARPS